MSHDCHCQTGQRTLALIAPALTSDYGDLLDFARVMSWTRIDALDVVCIPFSGCGAFKSVSEVANMLAGVLGVTRLAAVRGTLLDPGLSVADQADRLATAGPVLELADRGQSPLLKMLLERRIDTWFQPIFTAGGFDLWGYECLMRGRDEAGNLVFPDTLLKWATDEQLVFMLDRVCRETHLLNAGKADLPAGANILINFMPTSIYKPEFCLQTTLAAAKKANIDPARIIFEVVESERITDRAHLSHILNYYRQNGYRVALDDLGSGYAGLSLLAELDPDLIKIDRELIARSTTSPMHRAICEALVRIGKATGKLVLAEGVERAEEVQLMRDAGVDLFQGYYFGRPNAVAATRPLVHECRIAA